MTTDTRPRTALPRERARSYPRSPRSTGSRRSGSRRWAAEDTYAFDRAAALPARASRSTRSTPRRRRPAARCTSGTSSATPTPTSSPATSGCAASTSSTRWAGTTTACPPSAGCRTTTASAATRRCPTTRRSRRRRSPARTSCPISRRNFVELCMQLTEEDERAFEQLWRRVGLSVDWSERLPDDLASPPGPPRSGCSCTTWPAVRPTPRRRRPSGTSPSGRRWPRPSSRTASAPAPTTGSPSHGRRAARCFIETTRPELLPACVALVAHPDDERYQPLFGTDRADAAVRRRGAGGRAPPGRAGQGLGHRDDLHLRRPQRRHLVARAAAADPRRSSAGTAGSSPTRRPACRAGAYAELAGKTVVQRAAADRRAAARVRRPRRRAEADHPPGEVLREGRAPAGDRHHAAVVHPQRRPGRRPARRAGRARPGDPVGARAHAAPLRELGRGPQRRLADQPPAVLRRPVPGLVPRWTTTGEPIHDDPILAARVVAAGRPVVRRARRLHRGPARQARRLHGRPRRHGHLGDVVAVAAGGVGLGHRPGAVRARLPDGPAPAGARHHPHLAVLDRRPRRTSSSARCRGRTPRSPASSSTPTARRCRSRRATPRRRSTSWSGTAPTPSAGGPPARGRARTRRSTRRR